MAEQFLELGKALENVHKGRRRLRLPHHVADTEIFYSRHGVINPSNILLFQTRGMKPLLALAGYSLGKLHTEVSRSRQDPKILGRTDTYRSPEFELPDGLLRPRSDLFSLGCVFLEYITWFLGGDLDRFSDERLEKDIYGFEVDTFFIVEGNEQKIAVMKPAVKRWIEKLKEEEACSWYLIQMLDLIETKMMQVDIDKRIRVKHLVKELEMLKRACERDPSFYTENWKQ